MATLSWITGVCRRHHRRHHDKGDAGTAARVADGLGTDIGAV